MDGLNRGLPPFLITIRPGEEGLNNGLMMAQYTAAALVSENKVLAHPPAWTASPAAPTAKMSCQHEHDRRAAGRRRSSPIRRLVIRVGTAVRVPGAGAALAARSSDARLGRGAAAVMDYLHTVEIAPGQRSPCSRATWGCIPTWSTDSGGALRRAPGRDSRYAVAHTNPPGGTRACLTMRLLYLSFSRPKNRCTSTASQAATMRSALRPGYQLRRARIQLPQSLADPPEFRRPVRAAGARLRPRTVRGRSPGWPKAVATNWPGMSMFALGLDAHPACSMVALAGQHTADGRPLVGRNHDWYYGSLHYAAFLEVHPAGAIPQPGLRHGYGGSCRCH